MKTVIILLLSIITSTGLFGQNVFSFQPANKENEDTAKSFSEILNIVKTIKSEIFDLNEKKLNLKSKIDLLNEIKTLRAKTEIDTVKIFNDILKFQSEIDSITKRQEELKSHLSSNSTIMPELTIMSAKTNNNKSDFQSIFNFGNILNNTIRGDFWGEIGEPKKEITLGASLSNLGGTMFTEILVDYLGPFRFSLATGITTSKKEKQNDSTESNNNDALQNFLNAGGNAVIRTTFPLIYYSNRLNLNESAHNNSRYIGLYLTGKFSGDIPAFNSGITSPSGLVSVSIEIQYGFVTNKKIFGIEGFINFGGFYGSPDLMDNLTYKNYRKACSFSQGAIKLTLLEKYSIYLNFPITLAPNKSFALGKTPYSISFGTNY